MSRGLRNFMCFFGGMCLVAAVATCTNMAYGDTGSQVILDCQYNKTPIKYILGEDNTGWMMGLGKMLPLQWNANKDGLIWMVRVTNLGTATVFVRTDTKESVITHADFTEEEPIMIGGTCKLGSYDVL